MHELSVSSQIFQVLLMHQSATPAQLPVLPNGGYIHNSLFFQYPLQDSNL